jgi:hypothetical protein
MMAGVVAVFGCADKHKAERSPAQNRETQPFISV